ncbi:16S rRNA (cytosine(1402)-N(4))-methyltransferase RsmH [Flavobacteriales bacterium]|nr:16S rRNA (cytosine(1402)-N(4))-methyltransferase RsmH [Flavobacteriales bacterium]
MSTNYHVPVLFDAALQGLDLQPAGTYVDCTFGGGGHSRGILDALGPNGRLFGFDCDPDAEPNVPDDSRFTLIPENFRFAANFLRLHGVKQVDGILADLGVSSHQFDAAERGFSIRGDGALDMRMDPRLPEGADGLIQRMGEQELTHLLRQYGELSQAHRAARALRKAIEEDGAEGIASTGRLQSILAPLAPPQKRNQYLAQAFQALRIAVNDELGALSDLLKSSLQLLKPSGRLVVISYHSLEDRMVKRFMRAGNMEGEINKDFHGRSLAPFDKVTGKAIVADADEMERNPRSRSARMRIAARNTLAA